MGDMPPPCHRLSLSLWAPDLDFRVEAMGLEPTNLLTASQALYQLSYAPGCGRPGYQPTIWPSVAVRARAELVSHRCVFRHLLERCPEEPQWRGGSIAGHGEGLRRAGGRREMAGA